MKAGKREKDLRGLVLSGGESRRMGQDKGLIMSGSDAWVNRAGMLLQSVSLPVAVMIREAQWAKYTEVVLSDFEVLHDLDLPVGGPLKGLLSFHSLYPQSDVLAIPCDMPKLTSKVLRELVGHYLKKPAAEAWVFRNQNIVQPFPGIYSARFMAAISSDIARGTLSRHGLTHLLNSANAASRAVFEESVFKNFNHRSDI